MKLKTVAWILGVVVIIALIPIALLFYQNHKLQKRNQELAGQIQISEERISDSLLRAENKRAKDLDELRQMAREQGLSIEKVEGDLSTLNGSIEAIGTTTAKTETVVHHHYESKTSTPVETEVPTCPEDGRPIDIHGYTKTKESISLDDSNGMKVAKTSFEAAKENPWSSEVYGINYKINNVVGRSGDKRTILYTELMASSSANPNKSFRIEGVESRVLQAPESPTEFSWWDPAIYLNAHLALQVYEEIDFSAGISLGASIFSYGDNWRFLAMTLGYDAFQNNFRASLIPVLYNLGGPLPFFQDLWLSIDISYSPVRNIGVGFVIGTTL